MTIQAYMDEKGHVKHREISDRKKCLSRKEFLQVVNGTPFKNHVYMTGKAHFDNNLYHFASFNHWAGFPLVIVEINSMYGKGVEIILNTKENPSCTMFIRAYK